MTLKQQLTRGSTTTMEQQQQSKQQPKLAIMVEDEILSKDEDLDEVLEREEEIDMMADDEEIHSYDEDGQPIVDFAQMERRNLTVALVKSVVDTGGTKPTIEPRYGLRRRRQSESPDKIIRITQDQSSISTSTSTIATPTTIPNIATTTTTTTATTTKTTPTAQRIPPPTPRPGLPTLSNPPSLLKPSTTLLPPMSGGVPNPLLHFPTTVGDPTVCPITSSCTPTIIVGPVIVPCPLPAPIKQELGIPRGRIFSIDIDPAGLDFPDIGMDILTSQPDLTGSTPLPPISSTTFGSSSHLQLDIEQAEASCTLMPAPFERHSTMTSATIPMFISSSTDLLGRDRAMSFEFFSFGLNADEPLPHIPEGTDDVVNHEFVQSGRPRGDSIIYDPCSFREGGIHEEKALLRSRNNSVDLPSADELFIMNSPGFTTKEAPMLESSDVATDTVIPVCHSAQMATLPSSLNTTMNHATFQMDLLNKDGRIGIYLPDARKARIAKFHSKRKMRIWRKRIKYDCRKKLADSRPRIKGRFVKRSDMDDDEE